MAKRGASKSSKDAVSVEVDSTEVKRAAQALPGALESASGDALRKLGEQFVSDAQRKVRSGPGRPGGPTENRDRIARGISASVHGGRLTLSESANLPGDRRAFPAAYNSGRWQHPVFGRRARVSQRGIRFWDPKAYQDEAQRLIEQAGQQAADRVSR